MNIIYNVNDNIISNLKCFTIQDYIIYLKLRKTINQHSGLMEASEIYDYNINQPHDKLYKTILDSKKQVVELINRVLNLEKKLEEKDIEKYNSSFITSRFSNLESDIVYKKIDQDIFFLIEHQSKIDINMPRRILEYEISIMQEIYINKKDNRKIPLVIPIVIYTGNRKWNVVRTIEECQEKLEGFEKIKLGEYYILDINDYTNEQLKNDKTLLFNIFSLEKTNTSEILFEQILELIEKINDKSEIEILERIINYIFKKKLGKYYTDILLKKIRKNGSDSMIFEMIEKENRDLINLGKKEGKRQGKKEEKERIAIEMIKIKLNDNIIKSVTKFTQEQLDNLKKKILINK